MALFNIIETFFFLSLAITFLLILLLVNHFKQRINVLEQKSDTMFEIINNIRQQIDSMIYRTNMMQYQQPHMSQTAQRGFHISKSTPEVAVGGTEDACFIRTEPTDRIIVSDDDEEDDEDDDEEDDDEEDDDDEDDDDDEEVIVFEEHRANSEPKIKIINMELSETIDVENREEAQAEDAIGTEDAEDAYDAIDLEEVPPLICEADDLIIEKVTNEDTNETTDATDTTDHSKDIYSKMHVHDLKKLVITKGLCSDASKLKKNDLLKLLESSQ